MKKIISTCFIFLFSFSVHAQQTDSIKTKRLAEVVVESQRIHDIERLKETQGTYLWSGKKNEVISVQTMDANIAEKTPRQLFAKVPGVFVYDMDGTGNQMNISTRGLDPHRGWEFNIRKNGVITNSDMYGYPASHYSIPMEAIERIELVRGTGSLQYGAQFGGMLNYVTKKPDTTRAISVESINSIGSYGLLSTYHAIGGRLGKFKYYAYLNKRVSNGYRDNSATNFDAESVMIEYTPVKNLKLRAEIGRSNYIYQIPGPLTDSMFYANPRQSTRARNYFNPDIYIPSVTVDWKPGVNTKISWTTSAVLGNRNSVQFDKPANIKDSINPATLAYAQRQVDIDQFNSYTTELRMLHNYLLFGLQNSLSAGVQLMRSDLHRRQLGKGTTGSDFDLSLSQPGFTRDMHFKTKNIALYAENNFHISPKLSVSPGIRVEIGESVMSGIINYYDPSELPNTIAHRYPLLGVNAGYRLNQNQNFYGGWSQAYRPVIFKDIIPASLYEKVDKNLKDATGYNLELGYRGTSKSLQWDIGLFQLHYKNRLSILAQQDTDGNFYLLRTNIGNSITQGAEVFVQYSFNVFTSTIISIFTSTALLDGRYESASVRSGEMNVDITGNKIEAVPTTITRNGMSIKISKASLTLLYSYTGKSYSDALNTKVHSANGAVGPVPSYGLLDVNFTLRINNQLTLRVNSNNVTNKQYFTKRPTFYPGPGVWSSDGRSFSASLGIRIK